MKLLNSVVTGTALAITVAATPVSPNLLIEPSDTLVVAKTVISSNMRFIFAAGLEGTGHHYFVDVVNHMLRANEDLARIPRRDVISRAAFDIGDSMGVTAQHYSYLLDIARESMLNLAESGTKLAFPGTIVSMHGRNSYPKGRGPNKALKYLDIRMMAEVAEAAGVDFRLLYLRRPVKDILIANTIHREFQSSLHNGGNTTAENKYMEYMQILFTDVAVIHSFLKEIDPAFVVCHDFDRVGDVDQAAAIADFLAPNRDVAEMLSGSIVSVAGAHARSNETLLYEGADVVAARLQRKFDVFESQLCAGMS